MSLHEVMIDGTIQADGTLVLDEPTKLPAGRVHVVLRQEAEIVLPKDDPFWQRMQAMWAAPKGRDPGDGGVNTLAEVHNMRDEWEEHQQAIERLQEEGRLTRQAQEGPQS